MDNTSSSGRTSCTFSAHIIGPDSNGNGQFRTSIPCTIIDPSLKLRFPATRSKMDQHEIFSVVSCAGSLLNGFRSDWRTAGIPLSRMNRSRS